MVTRVPVRWCGWEGSLFSDDGVDEVEDGCSDECCDVSACGCLGSGDEEDASIGDGLVDVDGGFGLSEDGSCAFGGCVVCESCLDWCEGVCAVLPVPVCEVSGPPLEEEWVLDSCE